MSSCRLSARWKKILCCICLTVFIVGSICLQQLSLDDHLLPRRSVVDYTGVEYLPNREFIERPARRILYWPAPWHANMAQHDFKCLQSEPCDVPCDITLNKSEIHTVDAVDFNVNELWPHKWRYGTKETIKFPGYRTADQVWIVSNNEPPQHQYGDFSALSGIFNWTRWYRSDSTVPWQYARIETLNTTERKTAEKWFQETDFHGRKEKNIFALISDCTDSGRRYNLLKRMIHFMDIDRFGRCYKPCGTCDDVFNRYRFFTAFENNHCHDYVTEKYWNALKWGSIPIVNWHKEMDTSHVVPGSYININEFDSVQRAMEYIEKVNNNATLYKEYFNWHRMYKISRTCDACIVCRALNDRTRKAQVIKDLAGWHKNDICNKITLWAHIKQVINGNIFLYLGFGL